MYIGYISWFLFGIIYSSASCVQPNNSFEMVIEQDPFDSSLEFFPADGYKRAVTVVSHGLNNKPSIMLPLIEYLNESGSDVYLIKLFGHREDSANMNYLAEDTWLLETLNAYDQARALSDNTNVPLYFLGYSLGALITQYMIFNSNGLLTFDRQVLLAPATALSFQSGLLQTTFMLPDDWKLPSYTPEDYRANEGIPINVYKILFGMEKKLRKGGFANLNIPTLLIIDRKDELISYSKLQKYIGKYGLTQYRILTLESSLENRSTKYHHLIVDQATMGEMNWELSKRQMTRFLFEDL